MTDWSLDERFETHQGPVAYGVSGHGPPLVLVHGTPTSSYVWRGVVNRLRRDWTVYVYDLLGYGASAKAEGQDVSLAAQTRLLVQLLDHWRLGEPAIAGHDFGGAITLRTHLLERRPFRALTLMDPVALAPWGSPFFRLVRDHVDVFRQLPAAMHEAIVAAYLRGAFHRPLSDEVLAAHVRPWLGPDGQNAFYRQIAQADQRFTDEVEPLYGDIVVPTLILWGERDGWIAPETGRRLHSMIPGSRLELLPEAGHFLQEDAPEAVADALARFLASV
jgi:pimeloyl-ACP methyl ester carboxylesterase